MRGVASVYRWEVAKLLAQKRTYLGVAVAMVVPVIFVVVLVLKSGGGPNDIPLGRTIRETGLAVPFVALFFMSIWAFPLITALVAGDIVAAESHNGTLKTILTRSRERSEVFAGKALAKFASRPIPEFWRNPWPIMASAAISCESTWIPAVRFVLPVSKLRTF